MFELYQFKHLNGDNYKIKDQRKTKKRGLGQDESDESGCAFQTEGKFSLLNILGMISSQEFRMSTKMTQKFSMFVCTEGIVASEPAAGEVPERVNFELEFSFLTQEKQGFIGVSVRCIDSVKEIFLQKTKR